MKREKPGDLSPLRPDDPGRVEAGMDTQEASRSAPELMLTGVDDKTLGRTRL